MDIKELVRDISDFRGDYEKNGPMVEGIVWNAQSTVKGSCSRENRS